MSLMDVGAWDTRTAPRLPGAFTMSSAIDLPERVDSAPAGVCRSLTNFRGA